MNCGVRDKCFMSFNVQQSRQQDFEHGQDDHSANRPSLRQVRGSRGSRKACTLRTRVCRTGAREGLRICRKLSCLVIVVVVACTILGDRFCHVQSRISFFIQCAFQSCPCNLSNTIPYSSSPSSFSRSPRWWSFRWIISAGLSTSVSAIRVRRLLQLYIVVSIIVRIVLAIVTVVRRRRICRRRRVVAVAVVRLCLVLAVVWLLVVLHRSMTTRCPPGTSVWRIAHLSSSTSGHAAVRSHARLGQLMIAQ